MIDPNVRREAALSGLDLTVNKATCSDSLVQTEREDHDVTHTATFLALRQGQRKILGHDVRS